MTAMKVEVWVATVDTHDEIVAVADEKHTTNKGEK